MKVNILFGVFFLISCGESPDKFELIGTTDETETETETNIEKDSIDTESKESEYHTDIDSNTAPENDSDVDMDTDTDTDTDIDMDTDTDTDTDMDTDTDADTDTDTDTFIDDITDQDTETLDNDFVCESDKLDVTQSNGCPFNLTNQMYGHCVTEALWICALTDDIEVFAWNNFETEWTLCELQGADYICPSSYHVCAQSIKFGLKCIQ